MVISTRRSACLVLPRRPATSIDTTSPSISRLLCVCFSAPILSISHQAQISNSYASSNSLTLTFHNRLFYTLSDVLAYVQDFPVGHNCMYIYEDVVKQVETIFELRSVFTSSLGKAIRKNKSWALTS